MRPSEPSLISVVIPTLNGTASLDEQLAAVSKQICGVPFEVVVADDGSTDGTAELAMSWRDRMDIRVVRSSHRTGNAGSMAGGAAFARGDLLAYCDHDDVVHEGWLQGWLDVCDQGDLFSGRVDIDLLNAPRDKVWRKGGDWDELIPRLNFLPAMLGGNFAMWRDVWDAVGGTDPAFVHGADFDLAFRAQLAGFTLVHAPGSLLHYRYRIGAWPSLKQRYTYGTIQAHLYAKFRDQGMPQRAHGKREFVRMFTRSYRLLGGRERAARHLSLAAQRLGRVSGSIRYRTFYV